LSAWINEQLTISNCGRIDNFRITCDESEDWTMEPYIHFDNCNFVSNVYLTSNSNTRFDIQYNNCKQIHNCYGHKDESLTQEDLSKLALQLFPEVHNSGNWVGGDNWYTIATTAKTVYMTPAIFRILARSQPKGGAWTSAYVIVNSCFDSEPDIVVLTCQQKYSNTNPLIDKVRVVTPKAYSGQSAYLQVHVTGSYSGFGKNGVP
jgi:hypothetical protein